MKKRNGFTIALFVLAASLILLVPASASGVGFTVDLNGAYGFGEVPADVNYEYYVRLVDPMTGTDEFVDWDVIPGPASFDPVVVWPVEITCGTDPHTSSYYYWDIWIQHTTIGIAKAEGHFDCEPPPPPPPGGEACTPGYWRNLRKHGDEWEVAGIDPEADFDATFGVDLFDPDITLGEAVKLKGGGVNRLAKFGTASLLSAAHPDVDFGLTVAEVIAFVQAGDADALADQFDSYECPLN